MTQIYQSSDYETPELLYDIIRLKLPKDPRFTVTYKTRDDNKEGSVGLFIYNGPNQRVSFDHVVNNTAKAHIEVTSLKGQVGEEHTAVYLKAAIRNLEENLYSPVNTVKLKQIKHLGTGPCFIKRNTFGLSIYTVDVEIRYIFKSELERSL